MLIKSRLQHTRYSQKWLFCFSNFSIWFSICLWLFFISSCCSITANKCWVWNTPKAENENSHTEFYARVMRILLCRTTLHLCYRSQFQQVHKRKLQQCHKDAFTDTGGDKEEVTHTSCGAKCTFTVSKINSDFLCCFVPALRNSHQNCRAPCCRHTLHKQFLYSDTLLHSAAFVA